MVRTNPVQSITNNSVWPSGPGHAWLWLGALVLLPFASYLSLGILVLLMLNALGRRGGKILKLLWHQGYGWWTLGLLLSAMFAINPGDSWLQLANFLPYFLLVGVLSTASQLKDHGRFFTTTAQALVLGSLPFSVAALVEYIVRFPTITARVRDWAMFQWIFDVSFVGHRAHGGLSHPNILGNYLVIILGLGLGLLLTHHPTSKQSNEGMSPRVTALIAIAVTLASLGIFCTSSRNGLMAAMVLLGLAGYRARRVRWVWFVGLAIATAIVIGLTTMGFGGRALSLGLFTNDPRVAAWQLAVDLIQQRPLTGWGLGGFSHQYEPFSVTGHERLFHPHNLWLYLACDTGIPTMLLACWVVGRTYVTGLRNLITGKGQSILLSYLLALTGCILFALFDVTLFDARTNVLSWFLLASIGVLHNHSLKNLQPQKQR